MLFFTISIIGLIWRRHHQPLVNPAKQNRNLAAAAIFAGLISACPPAETTAFGQIVSASIQQTDIHASGQDHGRSIVQFESDSGEGPTEQLYAQATISIKPDTEFNPLDSAPPKNNPAQLKSPRPTFTPRSRELDPPMAANTPAMIPDSPTENDFRMPQRGTLTTAPLPPQIGDPPKVNPTSFARPEPDDDVENETAVSSPATGTFSSSQSFQPSGQGFQPPRASGSPSPGNAFGPPPRNPQRDLPQPTTDQAAFSRPSIQPSFNSQAPTGPSNRRFNLPTGPTSSNDNALRTQPMSPQPNSLSPPPGIRSPAASDSSYYSRGGNVASSSSNVARSNGASQPIETRPASALPPDTGARTDDRSNTAETAASFPQNNPQPASASTANHRLAALPAVTAHNSLRQPAAQTPQRPAARSAMTTRPAPQQNQTRNQTRNLANATTARPQRQAIQAAKAEFDSMNPAALQGLNGSPIQLTELFSEPLSGEQRKAMTAQYWETYYDLAAVKIAADHQAWLENLRSASTPAEQGLLDAAKRMAADRKLAAEIQLGKSQSRLMDFMPTPRPEGFLPIPADQPLIGEYKTDYEKYKRIRNLPSSLRGIDDMLARTFSLITQRSQTVSAIKTAANQAQSAAANQQTPLASALAAGQLWRDSRMDLVASAVSYNQAISDYILTVEPYRPPVQLSALMIGAPRSPAAPMLQTDRGIGMNLPVRSAQNPNANTNFGVQPQQPLAPIQFR